MHPNQPLSSAYTNTALKAATEAAKIINYYYDNPSKIKIHTKSHGELCTNVDQIAEEKIIDIIFNAFPDHQILAEESGHIKPDEDSPYQWIIDPIDGTTNFIAGLPIFAISIGLKYQDEIIFGIIYQPLLDELFIGNRDTGSTLNQKRIKYRNQLALSKPLILGISSSTNFIEQRKKIAKITKNVQTTSIRQIGSTALALAYCACERIHLYIGTARIWDIAAGIIINQGASMVVKLQEDPQQEDIIHVIATSNPISQKLDLDEWPV